MGILSEIRAAAGRSGKTQRALCRATGLNEAMISRLIAGKRGMRLENLDTLATALGYEFKLCKIKKGA